jgi:hypothetical protein
MQEDLHILQVCKRSTVIRDYTVKELSQCRDLQAPLDLKVLEGSPVLSDLLGKRVLLERLGDKERKEKMAPQEWRALLDQLVRRDCQDLLE